MLFRLLTLLASIVAVALLGGCQSTESVEQRRESRRLQEERESQLRAAYLERIHDAEAEVWGVLQPLLESGADYHEKETAPHVGAVFVSEAFYGDAFVKEARARGFGPFVSVLKVFPDSPAQRAGLREGDRLLSVNGKKVPEGYGAAQFAVKRFKKSLDSGEENVVVVQRGKETLELSVVPDRGVYYGVVIVPNDSFDLHVDGDVIWLGLSLVERIEKGEDLAYLLAYALAKNVMRHPEQQGKNAFLGQLLDIAAMASGVNTGGAFGGLVGNAYSAAFEVEADLIALYLLASAGYEIEAYPDYWEEILRRKSRKGELKPKEIERVETMRKVIRSIEEKRAAGEPIFPEEYLQGDVSEIE